MRGTRWMESIGGVLAMLAGLAAVVYLLLGPGYATETCTTDSTGQLSQCVRSTRTLIEVNGATAIFDLALVVILVVGVGISAVWHARTGRPAARGVLWGCAVVLLVFSILSGFSIGLFLLPSAALALVAALASLGNRRAATA
jgi:hypothetical protein